MSTYVDLHGDPDGVIGIGAMLRARAESFNAQANGILSEINSKEAGAPWGDDETGKGFLDQYHAKPEGADGPFDEVLKTKLQNAGNDLGKLGDNTVNAIVGYLSSDTISSNDITKVKDA
jgi:hypothetical protein